jgi:SAM-dependent methyltransferase
MVWNREELARSYDRVAQAYADKFARELDEKPFDRELLAELAGQLRGRGPVCDLGCGPGHVARFLADHGLDVVGIDLAPAMVEVARRLQPALRFEVGNLLALGLDDASMAGAVAFYSLIHVQRSEMPLAAAELHRVLAPGGILLVAVHQGDGEIHADEFLGQPASFDATLFQPDELAGLLAAAGLRVERVTTRPPYPVEYPSTRIYVTAVRP